MAGSGEGPTRKRATIKDVAVLAGVDPSLVSRVVNNDPKAGASEATRQRIHSAVSELGYSPSPMARGLRMDRTWTLGLLLPSLSNPMYATIARAASERAEEAGYGFIFGTHVEGEQEATFTRLLQNGRVDGLLVASGLLGDAFLRRFVERGHGPVVMVNRRVRGVKPSVIVNDGAGTRLAVEFLASLGHTSVAGLFGPSAIDTSKRRRVAFDSATADAGMRSVAIEAGGFDAAAGLEATYGLLDAEPDTTAIFASTFAMGMGAMRAARELGKDVPGRLSVIALHDSELAAYLTPPMTTVELPVAAMAAAAVDLLIELIDQKKPRSIVVDTPPILRERLSTSPPHA